MVLLSTMFRLTSAFIRYRNFNFPKFKPKKARQICIDLTFKLCYNIVIRRAYERDFTKENVN